MSCTNKVLYYVQYKLPRKLGCVFNSVVCFSTQIPVVQMEDDEDLEFLRLAALKSVKKNVAVPPAHKSATTLSIPKPNVLIEPKHMPVVRNAGPAPMPVGRMFDGFYSGPGDLRPPPIVHPADTFVGGRLEQMDLNDPYVPQQLNTGLNTGILPNGQYVPATEYVPFVPIPSVLPATSVQLSPRSAAFVSQNNDILMRRKGGRSPGKSRSPSPLPYRDSPGRWSVSPPPKILAHRSPNRSSPNWINYRRSSSRSPANHRIRSPRRSPVPVRHTLSRSPPRHTRRYSPNALAKSRSPNRNAYGNNGRPRSRSPHPSNRRPSPSARNEPKNWRRHSPAHPSHINRPNGPNGPNGHRSQSPRSDMPPANYQASARRRTRSPAGAKLDMRKRSNSRSPLRKYQRNGPPGKKRRSPLQRKNMRNEGGNDNRNADHSRNNRRGRRSQSPRNRRRSGSRTRNMPANPDSNDVKNNGESSSHKKDPLKETEPKTENASNDNSDRVTKEKTEQEMEDDLLASSDNEEDSSPDDGIDLFASEESESENEGRFKSSSSKTERTASAATLSFSKLGSSAAPVVRDLNEVQSDKATGNRRDKDGGGRDRGRNSDGRRGFGGRRNDRGGGQKSGSRDRERRDRNGRDGHGSNWKNAKHDGRKRDGGDVDKDEKSKKTPPKSIAKIEIDVKKPQADVGRYFTHSY